jgi:hypothetical protein
MGIRHLHDACAGGLQKAPQVRVSAVHKLGAELDGVPPSGGPCREDAASQALPRLDQHDLFSRRSQVTCSRKPGNTAPYDHNLDRLPHRFISAETHDEAKRCRASKYFKGNDGA